MDLEQLPLASLSNDTSFEMDDIVDFSNLFEVRSCQSQPILPRLTPRQVSYKNVADMPLSSPKTITPMTPMEELRELAMSKKRASRDFGSLCQGPVSYVRDMGELEPTNKRGKTYKASSALHLACCQPNIQVHQIRELLLADPSAAARPEVLESIRSVYNPALNLMESRRVKEPYRYPVNLAIRYVQSADVIEMLVAAAPEVLLQRDGLEEQVTVAILLHHRPKDVRTLDIVLLEQPKAPALTDRHYNTPLHIAVAYGAEKTAVRHLDILYPMAMQRRNFYNKTPLEMAQQTTAQCDLAVVDYLWQQQAKDQRTY